MLSARHNDPHLALGLALVAIGGLGLQSCYQGGLVILGLATLGSATVVRLPPRGQLRARALDDGPFGRVGRPNYSGF